MCAFFRLPAYVSGLKSGKINGKGKPEVKKISSNERDTVLIPLLDIIYDQRSILN